MGLFPHDNQLNYSVAMFTIELKPWTERIVITWTSVPPSELYNEFLEIIKEAWECTDEDIKETKSEIIISLNYLILCRYVAHTIVIL